MLAQRAMLEARGEQPGEMEDALEQAVPDQVAADIPGRVGAIEHLPYPVTQYVEEHAERYGQQAGQQRRGDTAPQIQVYIHRAARHGLHRIVHQPGFRPGIPGAEQETADGQQHRPQPHRQADFVRHVRIVATLAEEGLQEDQAGSGK